MEARPSVMMTTLLSSSFSALPSSLLSLLSLLALFVEVGAAAAAGAAGAAWEATPAMSAEALVDFFFFEREKNDDSDESEGFFHFSDKLTAADSVFWCP